MNQIATNLVQKNLTLVKRISTTSSLNFNNRIVIETPRSLEIVPINDIIRVESYHNCTKVYLQDSVLTSITSHSKLEKLLTKSFIRCHKSHSININHIVRIMKEGTIIMSNGQNVPIARRRKKEIIESLVG